MKNGPIVLITDIFDLLGREIAKELHEACRVVGFCRNDTEKESLENELNCEIINCDTNNALNLRLTIEEIQKEIGEVDIIINNAGARIIRKESSADYVLESEYTTSVFGAKNCFDAACEIMGERSHGHIIQFYTGFDFEIAKSKEYLRTHNVILSQVEPNWLLSKDSEDYINVSPEHIHQFAQNIRNIVDDRSYLTIFSDSEHKVEDSDFTESALISIDDFELPHDLIMSMNEYHIETPTVKKRLIILTNGEDVLAQKILPNLTKNGKVVILGKSNHTLELISKKFGCEYFVCDILDRENVKITFSAIRQLHGEIDALINNGGLNITKSQFGENYDVDTSEDKSLSSLQNCLIAGIHEREILSNLRAAQISYKKLENRIIDEISELSSMKNMPFFKYALLDKFGPNEEIIDGMVSSVAIESLTKEIEDTLFKIQ